MSEFRGRSASSGRRPDARSAAGVGAVPAAVGPREGFRIGPWWVDPSTGRLRHREGEERHLRPQEMDLLCRLAAAAGRVVSREEILATVWEGAAVEEGAVSRCVSLIRKALGDDAAAPRFIETIPKRGYRLIAAEEPVPVEPARKRGLLGRPSLLVAAASGAVAIATAIALGSASGPPEPAVGRPAGAAPAIERRPADERGRGPAAAHLEAAREAQREVDYPRLRAAAARAALTARAGGDPATEAEALLLEAGALEALGEVDRADEAMSRARSLLEAAGDRCGLARASLVFRDTADPRRAPVPLAELPELLAACGDPAHQAIALARLARSRLAQRPAAREPLLDRALPLAELAGSPRALAEVWNAVGVARYVQENLAGSESAFRQAVEFARRAEDPYLVAGMLGNRASVLRFLGRHREAAEVVREAADLARRLGNRYLAARILLSEANHELKLGSLDGAGAKVEEAHRLALQLGDPALIRQALNAQVGLLESRGEWRLAIDMQRRLLLVGHGEEGVLRTDRRRLRLANALLEVGEDREAAAIVDDVAARYPLEGTADSTAIYARFQAAQIDLHRGDPQRAAERFLELLPALLTKEEVGLRRDAARFAVEVDRRLAEPRLRRAWFDLGGAPRAGPAPAAAGRALQAVVDRGRLLWFAGDRAAARQELLEAARRARAQGRTGLADQLSSEIGELEGHRRYWSWRG